uniref:Looped-hinge helix DNA binding domain-containing protein, AbrB family n=1 Tax=Candidatus Kentrum sp. LFY TaxID=2126342 RepID=A0A450V238_9GAMM|nr:MAG: looped-hinge helix DNA binding domain-containing protein, AbrB family [Candidatus Kentron sp. LFY]VFJ98884.1 MAG: looped-hinge helix DNA binding domain-containing protein, AbrB family [Candidatus Kentron sp. LFY]VFK16999.1 MAG: looped-hinge helix DNA binding domain-containing protein, AbrB family [Candidatus Kentron sp. LFY]
MRVKVTAKRQVTFPAAILEALGVQQGDYLELWPSEAGIMLKPQKIDPARLAPLKQNIRQGLGTFDLERFREETYDAALRD